jgi:hypothetical protein
MAGVTFDGVAKVYPDGTRAVDHFVVFLAFQRYFVQGLLAGSVK